MAKKMLIDATHPEETRVVVVDGQKVEDFDFESITKRQLAGNIYLAKVTRVEPSLQAAFVEYGGNRHGFLAFSEIHPDYYQIPIADREALLAEEAREEEARRSLEESADEEKPRKTRRSRSRKKTDSTGADDTAAAVAGLEVIEVDGEDPSGTPTGFEIASLPDEEPDSVETEVQLVSLDPAGDDVIVARDEPEGSQDIVEETADDKPAEAESSVTDENANDLPPKSIAESAGLEDEERVTEEIGDTGSARTIAADDAAPDTIVEATETLEAPADAVSSDSEDISPEADASSPADDDAAEVAKAESADQSSEGEADDEDKQVRKPRRKRRSRSRKSDEKPAQEVSNGDAEDGEQAEGDVESIGAEDTLEEAARARTRLRRKYKIQDVVKVRQILLIQVVKEERGNKGAALTTYLSLAGRYCVLMPNTARGGGISRKITNASDRKRLREITGGLDVPQGMGLIVRTAGAERTKAEIKRDYEFLIRQWEQIRERTLQSIAPALIYEEGSLIKRSIRDVYSKEIDQVLVEGETGYREAKEYMKMLMPSHAKNVQPYTDPIPLFSRFQVESYLNGMFNPTVQLKSGGYIVIGVTEALVAIDVNSGRATKQGSIEETALQTNLEAADEVARQLRLRDLAGLIVIDFIDMDENRNNRAVEKRMKDRLKNDRARIQVGRISAFGLMEMSRQRLRPGMLEATTQPCPHCMGVGLIRSDENMSLSILREVEEEALRGRSDEVTVRAPLDVANYLINHKRETIKQIEDRHGISIIVLADPSLMSPNYEIERSKTAPTRKPPREVEAISASSVGIEEAEETADEANDSESRSRRRRGRRGGKRKRGGEGTGEQTEDSNSNVENAEAEAEEDTSEEGGRSRRGRGRRRGGRGRKGRSEGDDEQQPDTSSADAANENQETPAEATSLETAETVSKEDVTVDVPAPAPEAPAPEPEVTPAPQEVADAPVEDAPVVEEPVVEEPVQVAPVVEEAPKPDEPPRPKKRGWWSFGG